MKYETIWICLLKISKNEKLRMQLREINKKAIIIARGGISHLDEADDVIIS